jgi:polyferredoxin
VWSPPFLATALLLALFVPVYLSGHEGARLLLQGLSLALLGVWLNTLVTEVDLVNLSLGRVAAPADNPQRWLLLGFVGVSGLLLGQVWCGYLCPFGALQEFVSRLGRRLGLRGYARRPLDTRLRFLKFGLLALMLGAVWGTGETYWASFDPMQHAFGGRWEGWMALLLALVLAAALFHYRFWCRYLCPLGAFLALTNKLALLQRLAPRRRFEHCDLGVKEAFDVDCIRCNRCLSGRDTGVRGEGDA